jgi:AcrR family transcriptional regulator
MQEVLDAAADMFHERGYANTSVEGVASAVGLLKGSLYYYIESKEDLLFRIVDEVNRDVQAMLDEAAAQADLPPLDRIARFTRRQVEYNARNVKRIAVYHHDWQRLGGDRLADIRRRRREHEQAIGALLVEAQERGDVAREVDTTLATQCVLATIVWPYTWYRPGRLTPERLGEFCARFVLQGVSGRDAAR